MITKIRISNPRSTSVHLALQLACFLTPLVAQAGTLLEQSFPSTSAWSGRYGYKWGAGAAAVTVPYPALGAYGTIDTYGSTTPSTGLRLSVNSSGSTGYWEAAAVSGLLPSASAGLAAGELTPEKVSISFDCWANYSRPILVRVESFTTTNASSLNGRSEAIVYPAAAGFYQRKVLELSNFAPSGTNGAFKPSAPYYQITFAIDSSRGRGWPKASALEARFDNVNISNPALYVDAVNGRDWDYGYYADGGKTEARPFQTVQGAVAVASAGDIILVRARPTPYRNYGYFVSGTSNINYNANTAVASFSTTSGSPSKWVVLKNYPGENPIMESSGTHCVVIGRLNSPVNTTAKTSYIEIRGFEMVGVAQQLDLADPGEHDGNTIKGTGAYGANTSGVSVVGNYMSNKPHHIRVADNLVHDVSAGGIGASEIDWFTIENNVIYNTSWWTNSATSAISILTPFDFPGTNIAGGDYRILISGNEVFDNECRKKWTHIDKYSDGNGIIVDKNRNFSGTNDVTFPAYRGRTLVQNNLSYRNGGSGIHAFISDNVDIVNNSTHSNSRRSEFQDGYGEIYAYDSNGIRVYNNVMIADSGKPLNDSNYSTNANPANRRNPRTSGVTFRNNVYKFNDTDINGSASGGVTVLYPVVNNTPVVIRQTPPYQQWQTDADLGREAARLNENADAALAENNLRTYTQVFTNAAGNDYTLAAGSGARQRGTLVIGNSNSTEVPFISSLDIELAPRVQGTLAAPTVLLPDAGAIESPTTY